MEDINCGDFHIHSEYSPSHYYSGYACKSNILDILKIAKKNGLNAIAVTDHNKIKGSLLAEKLSKKIGVIAIPSMEISSKQGHILAYNVTEKINPKQNYLDTIDLIREMGGLAVCAHPLMKVFSVGKKRIPFFDGVECFNSRQNKLVPSHLIDDGQFVVAGTDAHTLDEIGRVVTTLNGGFETKDDLLELFIKKKTSYKILKRTSKRKDVIVPQIKNIAHFYRDRINGNGRKH